MLICQLLAISITINFVCFFTISLLIRLLRDQSATIIQLRKTVDELMYNIKVVPVVLNTKDIIFDEEGGYKIVEIENGSDCSGRVNDNSCVTENVVQRLLDHQ